MARDLLPSELQHTDAPNAKELVRPKIPSMLFTCRLPAMFAIRIGNCVVLGMRLVVVHANETHLNRHHHSFLTFIPFKKTPSHIPTLLLSSCKDEFTPAYTSELTPDRPKPAVRVRYTMAWDTRGQRAYRCFAQCPSRSELASSGKGRSISRGGTRRT